MHSIEKFQHLKGLFFYFAPCAAISHPRRNLLFRFVPGSLIISKSTNAIKKSLSNKYEDLRRFSLSFPVEDYNGNDTLWRTVHYEPYQIEELNHNLTATYALLRADEERGMIAARIRSEEVRTYELLDIMREDDISPLGKVLQLGKELFEHHGKGHFQQCRTMGALVAENINLLLAKAFRQSIAT